MPLCLTVTTLSLLEATTATSQRRPALRLIVRPTRNTSVDPEVLERIVAEEREAKGKLPKYPGLERWQILEKMGDGAFSNVYRARDTTGQWGEVAIKVVRKFEMNSQQVSITQDSCPLLPIPISHCHYPSFPTASHLLQSLRFLDVTNTISRV
jgi:hypothetical protein